MKRHFKFVLCINILVVLQVQIASSFRVPLLSEELGCSPTLSSFIRSEQPQRRSIGKRNKSPSLYYFDPFNLATDTNFPRYREAEYKHGRVAMLAMTEIILVPIIKRLPFLGDTTTSLLPSDHAIVTSWLQLQFNDIAAVLVTCGVLELFIFVQQDVKDMPGDYGVGYFGYRNKGLHEQQLVMELEHGRLAMTSFAIYMLLDTTMYQQMSWLDQWIYLFESITLPNVLT